MSIGCSFGLFKWGGGKNQGKECIAPVGFLCWLPTECQAEVALKKLLPSQAVARRGSRNAIESLSQIRRRRRDFLANEPNHDFVNRRGGQRNIRRTVALSCSKEHQMADNKNPNEKQPGEKPEGKYAPR
jgi:hypothetical protein